MDDPTPHLERFSSYDQAIREFQCCIPQRINIAASLCRRHRDSITRIALSDVRIGGVNTYTFGGLDYLSDKFATALSEGNIKAGDAVAVALRPSVALAVSHLGSIKTGGVVVPISPTATSDFVGNVLERSKAKVFILDESLLIRLEEAGIPLNQTESLFVVRDVPTKPKQTASYKDFWSDVDRCSSDFTTVEIESNSPVFIFFVERQQSVYGVVHSARSVISQLSGFEFFNEFDTKAAFWLGGDWSSASALMCTLFPSWWYGCSVIADSSEKGLSIKRLGDRCEITNVFSSSQVNQCTDELSTMMDATMLSEAFGIPESGWLIGTSRKWVEPGVPSECRVVPGRMVDVIDSNGKPLLPGAVGHIAIHKSDPGLFTGYQGQMLGVPLDEWFLIGESGFKTEAGELRFVLQG